MAAYDIQPGPAWVKSMGKKPHSLPDLPLHWRQQKYCMWSGTGFGSATVHFHCSLFTASAPEPWFFSGESYPKSSYPKVPKSVGDQKSPCALRLCRWSGSRRWLHLLNLSLPLLSLFLLSVYNYNTSHGRMGKAGRNSV